MSIALRISVTDRHGAAAVPALLEALRRQRAQASFIAPPRWLSALRPAAEAGHEVGLIAFEAHGTWRRRSAPGEVETELMRAIDAFARNLGASPRLIASDGRGLTPDRLRLTQRLGFAYASDTRGRHPYVPVWQGEIVRCPQIPVTLPMCEELAAAPRADWAPLCPRLLAMTAEAPRRDQLFALQASRTLLAQLPALEELLTGWREQGHELVSIRALAERLDVDKLPRHEIILGEVPGCPDPLPLQGEEFLSDWRHAT